MFLFLLGVTIVILFLMEVPALYHQKLKRDIVVFCCLLAISAYLGSAQIFGWPIPNPSLLLLRLFSGS